MMTEKDVTVTPIQQKKIEGIEFVLRFANIINKKPIPLNEISKQPIANVYTSKNSTPDLPSFTVNIICYIPTELEAITEPVNLNNSFYLNNENQIYLQYQGRSDKNTPIPTTVNCRDFEIVYEAQENQPLYNQYHIQFEYSIFDQAIAGNASAIFVQDDNLDPRTDRGTVSTPTDGPQ